MECKSLDPPAMLIISRRGTTTRHYNFKQSSWIYIYLVRDRFLPNTPFSDKLSLSLSLVPARVVDNFTFLESSRGNEEARLIASLFLRREQLTSIRPPSGSLYLISILLAHGLRIFRSNRTRHLPTKFSLCICISLRLHRHIWQHLIQRMSYTIYDVAYTEAFPLCSARLSSIG